MIKFQAIVSSRSSSRRNGPPGEKEILHLNPKRRESILAETDWDNLYEGTLNLEVQEDVVSRLKKRNPAIRESGASVIYPTSYQNIPIMRGTYLYFRGTINKDDYSQDVLFRTAENPLPRRIEAFAPIKLRDAIKLKDGDQVECVVKDLRRV